MVSLGGNKLNSFYTQWHYSVLLVLTHVGLGNGLLPDGGTKPSAEPVLANCEWDTLDYISKFSSKYN